ncbi:hypothetical protein CRE_17764 [Caenorhabditis remanei]|uniref:Uncharacterized protein n=1 Tax=Caenorhabditis remanei TaxID=31234 RepID=E3NSX9_CAERE|nr:hypothetical protein CRE_17764 [Caenorhabditis remanei]
MDIRKFLKTFYSLFNEVAEQSFKCFVCICFQTTSTFVLQVLAETQEVQLKSYAFYVCRDIAELWRHSDNSEKIFRGRRAEFYVQWTFGTLKMAERTEIVSIVNNIFSYFATSNVGTENMIRNGLFRKVKNHLKRARMSKNLTIELSPCNLFARLENIDSKGSMDDWVIRRLQDTSSPKTEHRGTFSYYIGTRFLVTTLEMIYCDDEIAKPVRDYHRSSRLGDLSVLQILSCAVEAAYQNPEHAIQEKKVFMSLTMIYFPCFRKKLVSFEVAIHFEVLLDQLAPFPLLLATDGMETVVYKLISFCTKTIEGDNGHALAFVWINGHWWKMNSGRKEATDFSSTSVVNDILIAIYEKDGEAM